MIIRMSRQTQFLSSTLSEGENTISRRGEISFLFRTVEYNSFFNRLHPSISMHFLHTVVYAFFMVLTRRICLSIKSFFSW